MKTEPQKGDPIVRQNGRESHVKNLLAELGMHLYLVELRGGISIAVFSAIEGSNLWHETETAVG